MHKLEEKWNLLNQIYKDKTNELKKQDSAGQRSEAGRYMALKKALNDCSEEELDYIEFRVKMELKEPKEYLKISAVFPAMISITAAVLSILSLIAPYVGMHMIGKALIAAVFLMAMLVVGWAVSTVYCDGSTQKPTYLLELIRQEQNTRGRKQYGEGEGR